MKLVICTKFHVNRMNCVESRRGGGPIDPLPPLKASCNYFFFEASRVELILIYIGAIEPVEMALCKYSLLLLLLLLLLFLFLLSSSS